MSSRRLELALKKQRLQMQSETSRAQFISHFEEIRGVLRGVDRIGSGICWIKANAPLLATVATLFLLSRPKKTWRLLRSSWFGWIVWRKARRFIKPAQFLLSGHSGGKRETSPQR